MISSIATALLLTTGFAAAQTLPITELVGTWSSKANKTHTGSGFYDPSKDEFIEPSHTGISYSFTADGFYEEAYYRAIANPQNPKCPKAVMQWQHGSFVKQPNGSLTLTPIAEDGRQLFSDPCTYEYGVYTRYNQSELFQRYEVFTDPYHNIPRLNIFKHDGSPQQPLYLAFTGPQMLPTTTLNPIVSSTEGAKPTGKVKRGDMPHQILSQRTPGMKQADRWWWFGVFMTAAGGTLYYFF